MRIFNPSPMKKYDPEIIENATLVIVNAVELDQIGGERLLEKYPNKLIVTLGEGGAKFHNGKAVMHIPTKKVDVVDTTGAGDTFMGALMVRLNEGAPIEDAVVFANTAAAIKCTKLGAQTGMPNREDVTSRLV